MFVLFPSSCTCRHLWRFIFVFASRVFCWRIQRFFFSVFFLLVFINTSEILLKYFHDSLVGKSDRVTHRLHWAAARAALPIPASVCSISLCPNNGMAASVWSFLTCTQMLMHLIAHGGCTNTARELALGGTSLVVLGSWTRVSTGPGVRFPLLLIRINGGWQFSW